MTPRRRQREARRIAPLVSPRPCVSPVRTDRKKLKSMDEIMAPVRMLVAALRSSGPPPRRAAHALPLPLCALLFRTRRRLEELSLAGKFREARRPKQKPAHTRSRCLSVARRWSTFPPTRWWTPSSAPCMRPHGVSWQASEESRGFLSLLR